MANNALSHEPLVIANATAATVAVVYIVCRLAFLVAPELSLAISRNWFHGIDITRIAADRVAGDGFVLGFITAILGGWLVGFVFAKFQNYFAK